LKELNRFYGLRQRHLLVNRMSSRDCRCIAANSGKRHMWQKRTIVWLSKRVQERAAQRRDFVTGRTLSPDQARSFRLWTIADMLEKQRESAEPGDHAAELGDRVG
jgi:hypothetical protein